MRPKRPIPSSGEPAIVKPMLILAAALSAAPALAQTLPSAANPGALQQRRIDEEERRRQLEQLERREITDPVRREAAPPPAAPPAGEAVRFMVREIRFTESAILPAEALAELAGPYTGREVSLAELRELAARIDAAYRERRVVTARAVIPPQDVSDGVVDIRLVEGRVGEIAVEGNASTDAEFITRRIGLVPGELVDLPVLEQDLRRFNRTQDAQLRADLAAGQRFGTSDLRILVEEPPRHSLRLSLDNGGSEGSGEWRTGLQYTNRSLLGFRDELSLGVVGAKGQESYSAGYSFPVNRSGGRLSLAAYKDHVEIVEGPLRDLDISGRSTGTIVALRQPVHLGERSRTDLVLGSKRRETRNWISSVPLQETQTVDGHLGVEHQAADEYGDWLATYTLTGGRAKGFERSNYTLGRAFVRRVHALAPGWSAQAGLNYQHSGHSPLPSGEQLQIGGEYSVRGYPVGVWSGDRGFIANLELHHPLGELAASEGLPGVRATGFFFADHGRVTPDRAPNSLEPQHRQLGSAGWGVRAAIGERVDARLTFARAFNRLPDEDRRYQVHFMLVAEFM